MSDWLINFLKKTTLFSSKKLKSNQIKSNIIEYISLDSTLQSNLIEGPFIYKVTGVLGDLWGSPQKYWFTGGGGVKSKNFES